MRKKLITGLIILVVTGCHQENNDIEIFTDKENHTYWSRWQDDTSAFGETGGLRVYKSIDNGSWWRISKDQSSKFESVFHDNGPDYYVNGLARFIKDGKIGFHDAQGKVIIAPVYDFATPFPDREPNKYRDYTTVCNGCWKEYSVMPKFAPLSSSHSDGKPINIKHAEHDAQIRGGKWGVIDTTGKVVVLIKYDSWDEAMAELKKIAK